MYLVKDKSVCILVCSFVVDSVQLTEKRLHFIAIATKIWHDVRPATYGNRDVDWRRFCSRGLLGTSTTPCVPFSVLELAINKQGQLLTFHVQVGYVKRTPEKTGTSRRAPEEIASWHVEWLLPVWWILRELVFSVSTFLNRLLSSGLKAHRPYVEVPLTVRHRWLRLNRARGHYRWSKPRWNRVLFTDESRFYAQFADGRLRVRR